ncbi:MAG: hypothetical protein WC823_06705 [Parcubacteria group bacterium]
MSEGNGNGFWGTVGACPARIAARRDNFPAKEEKGNPGIGDAPSSGQATSPLKKVEIHPLTLASNRRNPGMGDAPC